MASSPPTTREQALAHGAALLRQEPLLAAEQARLILRADPADLEARSLLDSAVRASTQTVLLTQVREALAEARIQDAVSMLMPRLREYPNDAAALTLLAETAVRRGLHAPAERFLRQAVILAPDYAEAQHALARLFFDQGFFAEAVTMLERMPRSAGAALLQAEAFDRLGDYAQALAIYEGLLEREPQLAPAWIGYGQRLLTVGRRADAVAAFRRAIALAPAAGEPWWTLARIGALEPEDIAAIDAALDSGEGGKADAAQLHFALARAAGARQDFTTAFGHYDEGNYLRRTMLDDEAAAIAGEVRRSTALFTAEFLAEHAGRGCDATDPIFIVGMPRSGSTLVEQMLAGHSAIGATSELPHLPALVRELIGDRWREQETVWPNLLAGLPPHAMREIGETYLLRARAHRKTDRPFFIDKLPHNWAHAGLIRLVLPNARIVDVRREAMDCCWSNFAHYFAVGHAASFSLGEIGRFYRSYVELMAHFDTVAPGAIRRVDYEVLVEAPEAELRALLGDLGLDFEPACLEFHASGRPVRTASADQVARPLNREGIGAWLPYSPWLDPLREALGTPD